LRLFNFIYSTKAYNNRPNIEIYKACKVSELNLSQNYICRAITTYGKK